MPLPKLLDQGRARGLAAVAALTLVQGVAAGAAACATRRLFQSMHGDVALSLTDLAILIGAGAGIAATRVAARRAGNVSLRFVGDMTAFRNWLGLGLPRLIAGSLLIPAALAVLWLIDPVFALAVLPILAPTIILIGFGGARLVPLQRRLRARIAAEMAERMPIAPLLDRQGRRGTEIAQLHKRTDSMVAAALRHRLVAEGLKALPDLAAGLTAALILLAGSRADVGTGSIAGALVALGLLLALLRDLGGAWNHRAVFRAAAIKAAAVLSRAQRPLCRLDKSLPKGAIQVVFEDVALPSSTLLNHRVSHGANANLARLRVGCASRHGSVVGPRHAHFRPNSSLWR